MGKSLRFTDADQFSFQHSFDGGLRRGVAADDEVKSRVFDFFVKLPRFHWTTNKIVTAMHNGHGEMGQFSRVLKNKVGR